jgi:hypothetical protein
VRSNNIRSGVVNPPNLAEGYGLHKHVLEVAPYFMNISPLDVDYVELLFGFDLQAGGNQDAIVAEAIYGAPPGGRATARLKFCLAEMGVIPCPALRPPQPPVEGAEAAMLREALRASGVLA